ncbi:hypothetical protein [Celerinatantimonas diazotrophica]|uniref:Uncharacterized protein n=1 Tax=Celerinatantimonas diazotrophica TaxID=412034 RepID=A0A4R1JB00_9GAMM|nr:hypothetical protein [Celerinatantimonas diazotrophica]TCK47694.1 hypothetical protein EV690_2739 [Celerinatantimonas diazotrophica]CAG9296682.1 hypothetical protein CEDIAZO_01836 [Celerinatantimonas diazotrophica]
MSNQSHRLLDQELALLLTPLQTNGVSSLSRIISAGTLLDIPIDATQVLYCHKIGELVNYLLNDTDIDAIILTDHLLTEKNLKLCLPLLKHLEQARLFIAGELPDMIEDFPDFCYCPTQAILQEELQIWHQQLMEHYDQWLLDGKVIISENLVQKITPLIPPSAILTTKDEYKTHIKPLLGIIYCVDENSELRQELMQIAHYYPHLPLLLIGNVNQPVLLHSCQHFAGQLNLNILASLEDHELDESLNAILVRFYRRYLRWLNHQTIYGDHNVGLVYQMSEEQPFGTFSWPPRKLDKAKHYYIEWQVLCEQMKNHKLTEAAKAALKLYQLNSSQLFIVFDGSPPGHEQLASVIDLLTLSIRICWIPRSVGQLLNTREQVGISQILIPITVWQELVADEQIFQRWQSRFEHQQVDIGLLGGQKAMLEYTIPCGLTLMAEAKEPNPSR